MKEVWKDIAGYEGLYQISNLGRVKSNGCYAKNRYKVTWRPGRVLKPGKDNKGYLCVVLCANNEQHTAKVHRLVAMAFIENSENKQQVNHINGNKQDNRVENLEWCTQSENMSHAWETGLQKRTHRKNDKRSITIVQCSDDSKIIGTFPSMMEAERQTGISSSSISRSARSGYKAGGYIWKYAEEATE